MERVILFVLALAALLVFGQSFGGGPKSVLACGGSEPFDVRQAVLIAEGWVDQVSPRPDLRATTSAPKESPAFMPVELSFRPVRILRGQAARLVTFVEPRSAIPQPDGKLRFAGGGGSCGILDDNPTGQYGLVVFARDAAGQLITHRGQGAVFASSPNDPRIEAFRADLNARLGPRSLPRAGAGGTALADGSLPVVPRAAGRANTLVLPSLEGHRARRTDG